MDIPRKVIDAIQFIISANTPAKECLHYLKTTIHIETYNSIVTALEHFGDKHKFFNEVGRKKDTFVRFAAAMNIMNEEEIYKIVIRELRTHCKKIGQPQKWEDYERCIEEEVKKLRPHDEEEVPEDADTDTVAGAMPVAKDIPVSEDMTCGSDVNASELSPIPPVTNESGEKVTGGLSNAEDTTALKSPLAPPQATNPDVALVVASPKIDQPPNTSTTSQLPLIDQAKRPNFRRHYQSEKIRSLEDLPGHTIKSIGRALDQTREDERRIPWWNYFLKNGKLPTSYKKEQEIKNSSKKGKQLIQELIALYYTVGELETLFEEHDFTEGLHLLRSGQADVRSRRQPRYSSSGQTMTEGQSSMTEQNCSLNTEGESLSREAMQDPSNYMSAKPPEVEAQYLHRDANFDYNYRQHDMVVTTAINNVQVTSHQSSHISQLRQPASSVLHASFETQINISEIFNED